MHVLAFLLHVYGVGRRPN